MSSRLQQLVNAYIDRVSGIEEHCSRCLNTERWDGCVVLMVVDAAFTSIGLNYFTAVVPKVEEVNKQFVETGRITCLADLAKADAAVIGGRYGNGQQILQQNIGILILLGKFRVLVLIRFNICG